MDVQWYPGHMTKARRMMEENIRLVDLVIELVDARIPMSSRNPDIDALCSGKGRVVLLCKADLADPAKTEKFVEYFREKGILALAVDARERKASDVVRRYVQEACAEKIARDRARGIVGRPLRAMVAGIPNVGKSTFINSFAGRASTKTGNKPGVTRGKQWIRLGGGVELLDTPGILWPKFDSQVIGMRLALVGAIRDEVLDRQELAVWLLDFLTREYPGAVEEKYMGSVRDAAGGTGQEEPEGDPSDLPAGYALLLKIARARRLLMKGGEPDADRAAAMLVDDCRNGRIGRISLDRPEDAQAMEEERRQFNAQQQENREAGLRKKAGGRSSAGAGRQQERSTSISGKAGGRSSAGAGRQQERGTSGSGKAGGRPSGPPAGKGGGKTGGKTGGNTPVRGGRKAPGKSGGKKPGSGRR